MPAPYEIKEYSNAVMPDGRILLIERDRAPRLERGDQILVQICFLILAVWLVVFPSPVHSIVFIAGTLSAVPLGLLYAGLTWVTWSRFQDWISSPPDEPGSCRVIGYDMSTDELTGLLQGKVPDLFQPGSRLH